MLPMVIMTVEGKKHISYKGAESQNELSVQKYCSEMTNFQVT